MTISQVWLTGPGQVEVRQVAAPTPKAGEVVVRTARAGICGSDLHTYRAGHVWLPYPIPPGHEASGIVETVGADVATVKAGDRVFLNPALTCGACLYCRTGHSNLCEQLLGIGAHLPGGMADAFVAPACALWPVPDAMSPRHAAMIEPLATGVHAARLAGGVRDRVVAILGGGTIGLCTLAVCLAGGATVLVSEPLQSKRNVALRWGAAAAVDARGQHALETCLAALSHRPDIVFDCVGRPETVGFAVRLATRAGTVVVIGAEHGTLSLPLQVIQDFEVHILGSSMYTVEDIANARDLLAGPCRQVGECVTSSYPIAAAPEAFARAAMGAEIKIQLVGAEDESWRG
jgi:2-desacetyl-2-hydroxyethyl bacteriochlorophyllide A dehydrogenase